MKNNISKLTFQADLNSDGVIDWDEFMSMMMPGNIAEQNYVGK